VDQYACSTFGLKVNLKLTNKPSFHSFRSWRFLWVHFILPTTLQDKKEGKSQFDLFALVVVGCDFSKSFTNLSLTHSHVVFVRNTRHDFVTFTSAIYTSSRNLNKILLLCSLCVCPSQRIKSQPDLFLHLDFCRTGL